MCAVAPAGGGSREDDAPSVAVAVTEEAARGAEWSAHKQGARARARRRPGSESALRAMLDFVAVFGVLCKYPHSDAAEAALFWRVWS